MTHTPSGQLLPARALDVRTAEEFDASPTLEAANIPDQEIVSRIFELPPSGIGLKVYETGVSPKAIEKTLAQIGRPVQLIEPVFVSQSDDRFRLWSAPEFLIEAAERLGPGRALCLACGVGREAVHLAALGWDVIAVDRLPDALERGRDLEARYLPVGAATITWLQHDLRRELPAELGGFDLVCQLFAWQVRTPAHFATTLAPSGLGLWEGFADRPESSVEWPGFQVVEATTGWRESRKTKRLLLRPDEIETTCD